MVSPRLAELIRVCAREKRRLLRGFRACQQCFSDMKRAGGEPHRKPVHLVRGDDAAAGAKAGGGGRHECQAIAREAQEHCDGEEEAVHLCDCHIDDLISPSLASKHNLSVLD